MGRTFTTRARFRGTSMRASGTLALLLALPLPQVAATESGPWRELPAAPIEGRGFHTAIWTGEEVIVWGGSARGKLFADGAAYDPEADRWRGISVAPLEGRTSHTAIWTGEEMVIWGGCCERRGEEFGDGAAYDPRRDRWRLLPRASIDPRTSHTAVWTGDEMLLWGGHVFEREFSDGAAYDPKRNRWRVLPNATVEPRYSHSAVWTGDAMFVWGGATTRPAILANGAMFSGEWVPVEPTRPGRSAHSAVWSGAEMLVWGGCCDESGGELPGGAAYEVETGRWRALPDSGLEARQAHVAVSAEERMLVWGGQRGFSERFADGAAYDPAADRWSALPMGPLQARAASVAVWTGEELVIWGGCCGPGQRSYADGAALQLAVGQVPSAEPTWSETAAPGLEPRDADFGVGALIALGGLIFLAAVVGFARAVHRRSAR